MKLDIKGLSEVEYLAKGKRGVVYSGFFKGKKVAVKVKSEKTKAETIAREISILKKINKFNIGPILISYGDNYFIMELIKGKKILDYLKESKREDILDVLEDIITQLKKLDDLGLSKDEMTHPHKHIIIGKKPVLIDFERTRHHEKPHNITQFCVYLGRKDVNLVLAKKGIFIVKDKLNHLCKKYVRNSKVFIDIKDLILQKNLQEQIYFAVYLIPKGETSTYKRIAEKVKSKAYRYVGQVMAKNPFAPIVPCHRVLGTNNLGGFTSENGLKDKVKLLESEGVKKPFIKYNFKKN